MKRGRNSTTTTTTTTSTSRRKRRGGDDGDDGDKRRRNSRSSSDSTLGTFADRVLPSSLRAFFLQVLLQYCLAVLPVASGAEEDGNPVSLLRFLTPVEVLDGVLMRSRENRGSKWGTRWTNLCAILNGLYVLPLHPSLSISPNPSSSS